MQHCACFVAPMVRCSMLALGREMSETHAPPRRGMLSLSAPRKHVRRGGIPDPKGRASRRAESPCLSMPCNSKTRRMQKGSQLFKADLGHHDFALFHPCHKPNDAALAPEICQDAWIMTLRIKACPISHGMSGNPTPLSPR